MWNRVLDALHNYTSSPLDHFRWVAFAAVGALLSTLPPITQNEIGFLCSRILCWAVISYLMSVTIVLVFLAIYYAVVGDE